SVVPENLQTMSHRFQLRSIDEHDVREAFLEPTQFATEPPRRDLEKAPDELPEDLGEELPRKIPATLEEGFWTGLDPRSQQLASFLVIQEGLAQAGRCSQDDRHPELHQRIQAPLPLAFGGPNGLKGGLAECLGDVLRQELQDPDEIDTDRRLSCSHGTSPP